MKQREALRWKIQDHYQTHPAQSYAEIARQLGTNKHLVRRWVLRLRAGGGVSTKDKPRPGQVRKLAAHHVAATKALALKPHLNTSKLILQELQATHKVDVSARTLRRHMRAAGLTVKMAKPVPLLSAANKQKRLSFAQQHKSKPWTGVAFSDSKYFLMHPNKLGRARAYWGTKGETRTTAAVRHGSQVHVYAAVTYYGVTPLYHVSGTTGFKFISPATGKRNTGVDSTEYVDMLDKHMLRDLNRLFTGTRWAGKWTLMQDNAPAHTAKATKAFMAEQQVRVLANWPPHSADLNPIENLWAWVETQLRKRPVCSSIEEFKAVLEQVWASVPQDLCRDLVKSMKRRLQTCAAENGGHVGY
jgi:transposase